MDLMSKAPSSLQELLQQVATLQRGRRGTDYNDLLAGVALFAAGMLVGAGLGILFAPSAGEKTRSEIADRVAEMRERMSAGGSHAEHASHA